jgi:hypothetical protein
MDCVWVDLRQRPRGDEEALVVPAIGVSAAFVVRRTVRHVLVGVVHNRAGVRPPHACMTSTLGVDVEESGPEDGDRIRLSVGLTRLPEPVGSGRRDAARHALSRHKCHHDRGESAQSPDGEQSSRCREI